MPNLLTTRVFFVALDGTAHFGDIHDAGERWAVIRADDNSLWTVPADRVICEWDYA